MWPQLAYGTRYLERAEDSVKIFQWSNVVALQLLGTSANHTKPSLYLLVQYSIHNVTSRKHSSSVARVESMQYNILVGFSVTQRRA